MKHEYLFTSLEKFEQVKEYLPDKVQRKIYKIENTESFVSVYSIEGEKKENTKILSKIDEEIRKKIFTYCINKMIVLNIIIRCYFLI